MKDGYKPKENYDSTSGSSLYQKIGNVLKKGVFTLSVLGLTISTAFAGNGGYVVGYKHGEDISSKKISDTALSKWYKGAKDNQKKQWKAEQATIDARVEDAKKTKTTGNQGKFTEGYYKKDGDITNKVETSEYSGTMNPGIMKTMDQQIDEKGLGKGIFEGTITYPLRGPVKLVKCVLNTPVNEATELYGLVKDDKIIGVFKYAGNKITDELESIVISPGESALDITAKAATRNRKIKNEQDTPANGVVGTGPGL